MALGVARRTRKESHYNAFFQNLSSAFMVTLKRSAREQSLKARIIITLVALLLIVSAIEAAAAFWLSRRHIDELMDSHLQGAAVWLSAGKVGTLGNTGPPQHSVDGFVGQVWQQGISVPTDNTEPDVLFDRNAPAGFSSGQIDGRTYRIYTLRRDDGAITWQVGQPLDFRQRTATQSAIDSLLPSLVRIPLVGIAIMLLVNAAFVPLTRASAEAEAVGVGRLEPLEVAHVPKEVRPFADSINRMIARLQLGIEAEKRFLSDAAHELRTPIAALQLRVDNLANAPDEASRAECVQDLREALARNATTIRQLLELARADARLADAELAPVEVCELIQRLVADLLPVADARQIDLGVKRFEPAQVSAREGELRMAVRNLMENALRYTLANGCIDIEVFEEAGQAVVRVTDTGPGIPEASLERVFDRFYRLDTSGVDGSGLGLSIVKSVVAKYRGTVVLENRDDGQSGLIATITLPRAE
jgi:two-component system OmpR family sensor kinase